MEGLLAEPPKPYGVRPWHSGAYTTSIAVTLSHVLLEWTMDGMHVLSGPGSGCVAPYVGRAMIRCVYDDSLMQTACCERCKCITTS